MIVPITCPQAADNWKFAADIDNTYSAYQLGQHLICYVYRDIPEKPLLIKAETYSHITLALTILVIPPMGILSALIVCIVARPLKSDEKKPNYSYTPANSSSCNQPVMSESEQNETNENQTTG